MGRAEEAGEPPRPDSPRIQHGERPDQATPPADTGAEPGAGSGGLAITERQLRALEAEVAAADLEEEDFSSEQEKALAERARRRTHEQQLVLAMRAEGFDGPVTHTWMAETAAYALAVLMSWMRTGQIVAECKAKGRPIALVEYGPGRWTRADRQELAGETVARALGYFITKVLAAGRWDPQGGAGLNTFFIGACLFQFSNVYDRWAREQRAWDRAGGVGLLNGDDADELTAPEGQWEDPTSRQVLNRARRREILQAIANPQTRAAARLILADKTIKEAAAAVGMNEKTLRTRLSRLRSSAAWDSVLGEER
ncbi:hypothetical protein [Actinomadura keratinilytica]|uniref:Sigma-70 family RNA polymerase sigma factor n=1 Tax=Actinomadura keratinilytica TaxID=547461 RepID=A0ABP7ZHE0_9ACTN